MLRKINKSQAISSKSKVLNQIILSVLSALLLIASFPKADLWFLAWFALVPLFFALRNCSKSKAFILSFFTGFIFWLGTIYWIWHVSVVGMLVLALYLAIYFGIFGFFFSFFAYRHPPIVSALPADRPALPVGDNRLSAIILNSLSFIRRLLFFVVIPAIWVVLEYIRAHFLTGFGWAILGFSQCKNIVFIQIADITGVYGISFILVAVNLLIFLILQTKSPFLKEFKFKARFETVIVTSCVVLIFIYGLVRLNQSSKGLFSIKIAVVQGNIRQDLKWQEDMRQEIFEKYLKLSEVACQDSPDLIIWPETSLPYWVDKSGVSSKKITDTIRKNIDRPVLLGCVFGSEDSFYNSALLFEKTKISNYNKIHLVPFGEYIPLRRKLPILEWIVNNIVPIEDFSRGTEYTVFNFKPGFSVLICFEDTIPELSRNFVKNGARLLVNITNDAWFGDTSSPFQHLQSSIFRAVENRVSLIRAANTGVSCFIDQNGKVSFFLKDVLGKKTFVDAVGSNKVSYSVGDSLTVYTRYGDIFVFICLAIAIYVIIAIIISDKVISKNI